MTDARLWDYDPLTGERTYWIYNEDDDTVTLRRIVDVEPILEANQALYNQYDERSRWGDWNHVATIPNHILDSWIREGIMSKRENGRGWTFRDNKEALRRLDDNDWKKLRTRPGSLSR